MIYIFLWCFTYIHMRLSYKQCSTLKYCIFGGLDIQVPYISFRSEIWERFRHRTWKPENVANIKIWLYSTGAKLVWKMQLFTIWTHILMVNWVDIIDQNACEIIVMLRINTRHPPPPLFATPSLPSRRLAKWWYESGKIGNGVVEFSSGAFAGKAGALISAWKSFPPKTGWRKRLEASHRSQRKWLALFCPSVCRCLSDELAF